MRRFPWRTVLIVLVAVAAVALPILFTAWRSAIKRSEEAQADSAEPFRIAGNFYYVGTSAASVFLITGPAGHVVLDSGYPPGTIKSIAKLGFDIKDVKALLATDAHEGANGMADLQRASGAELWASEASASVIADGGKDPALRQPLKFMQSLGAMRYTPARVDHRVTDGQTIRIGPIAVTAHVTSGSTRGCTSWSFPVRDGNRTLNVVSVCRLARDAENRFPTQDADLDASFRTLRSLPVDIWVTQRSRDWGRFRKFEESSKAKDPVKPFLDRGGYLAYIDAAEGDLRNGITH